LLIYAADAFARTFCTGSDVFPNAPGSGASASQRADNRSSGAMVLTVLSV